MMQRVIAYFCSIYITATLFCYFAFAKEIIEIHGYMGGSPVLNKFDDFLYYCLVTFLALFILCLIIFLIFSKSYKFISKRNFKLKAIHISLIYAAFWLLVVASVADGCSMNWGSTWSHIESFEFVAIANFKLVLPFLALGLLSTLLLEKYLQKQS